MVYREEQNFDWRAYALVLGLEVAFWAALCWRLYRSPNPVAALNRHGYELSVGISLFIFLPAALVIGFLRMTTEVTPSHLRVWFGWIPTYRRIVPLDAIARLEVVSYRPLADYWGWGIRRGRDGERVLNARGDRGVRIDFADGTRLLVGSQRPEDLALALKGALMPPGA
jgi:hypothetical protein